MRKIDLFEKGFAFIVIGLLICSGLGLLPTQTQATINNSRYDFIIITPVDFSNELQPLVTHKEQHAISTKIVTLDDIYDSVYFPTQGRDDAEKIKYFIKNAHENWGIRYVMLVGGKEEVPARYVDLYNYSGEPLQCISDLYYADLYFTNESFCSWDSNNDSIFAGQSSKGLVDKVDFCPDVAVGRILCRNQTEVQHIVEKIITYENTVYGKEWFHNLILCGGDFAELGLRERTVPKMLNRTGRIVWEGEYLGDMVAEIMKGFNAKKIYASGLFKQGMKFLTVKNINNAVDEGAGFLLFVGHGNYDNAIQTNFPFSKRIWLPYPHNYKITDSNSLKNGDKLPVSIFLGCYCGDFMSVASPVAWEFIRKENGGAIASFAATCGAFGIFSSLFPETFTPLLILNTFKFYSEGTDIMGDIWSKAIQTYLNDTDAWSLGDDFSMLNWNHPLANFLVLEEWILLGDPTLKIGGYS